MAMVVDIPSSTLAPVFGSTRVPFQETFCCPSMMNGEARRIRCTVLRYLSVQYLSRYSTSRLEYAVEPAHIISSSKAAGACSNFPNDTGRWRHCEIHERSNQITARACNDFQASPCMSPFFTNVIAPYTPFLCT